MLIEEEVFKHNINQKENALESLLLGLTDVNPTKVLPINRDVKALSDWDLAIYIATVLSINSRDFYKRSLTSITGQFTKAPFFTQEFAARITKASTVEPMLFSKIYEIKQNNNEDITYCTYYWYTF